MRVFVVGTGRCGTCSFYQAANCVEGFSAGHESTAGRAPTWHFPDQHIEVASQLAYGIPRLKQTYPDARWVHLIRERNSCIESLCRQVWTSMESFCQQWFVSKEPYDIVKAAEQFYDLTNELIVALMPPPPQSLTIHIETLEKQWPEFMQLIDAKGYKKGMDHSVAFKNKFNPGCNRGRDASTPL